VRHRAACSQPTARESTQTFVKRVVALPGDKISIVNGKVIRNGTRETGSYVQPCPTFAQCTFRQTIAVPEGDYYMLGDNRDASDDSRFWGPVPQVQHVARELPLGPSGVGAKHVVADWRHGAEASWDVSRLDVLAEDADERGGRR
jgi:signal peptidase I